MNKEIPGRSLPEEQITHSLEIILNELDPFAYALVLGGSAARNCINIHSDIASFTHISFTHIGSVLGLN
ncbi:MAG: hypothetical protein UU34_C0001G0087 [Candidatus Curtissbacteria bacterium GW2011_GWA1_41_11]|uniref:Uncharacterized protein n=1 Tax=Candidatus Curtissbacteria bacterium GW2011_GWA1_41_11 TaxID=1618409 RepID=A0A0G0WUK1_9BACT|nr:MAG: hypothetical protein UU34_C0001G0087 [Candidatus Curtissbacteria bacterium GW2011_GWA1_41_11]